MFAIKDWWHLLNYQQTCSCWNLLTIQLIGPKLPHLILAKDFGELQLVGCYFNTNIFSLLNGTHVVSNVVLHSFMFFTTAWCGDDDDDDDFVSLSELVLMPLCHHVDRILSHINGSKLYLSRNVFYIFFWYRLCMLGPCPTSDIVYFYLFFLYPHEIKANIKWD